MKNVKYWIWFTECVGYCNVKAKQITQLYKDIKEFYDGGIDEWRFSGIFSDKELTKFSNTPLSVADKVLDRCNELFYEVLTLEDDHYPLCLKDIDNPPAILYVSGMMPDVDNRMSIGVVGTRRVSQYGKKSSFEFANQLSKAGVTIVSGGALGVDCASHYGTLAADGVTICVLGCGINYNYLRENAKMRSDITFRGAVISEYPPDSRPLPYHFPQRNRIISALSDGLLVIEAGRKSGSLITVELAIEQDPNKKIFVLAGTNDPRFQGGNDLIKSRIAYLVTDYKDILDGYNNLYVTNENYSNVDNQELINYIPVKASPKKTKKTKKSKKDVSSKELSDVPVHKSDVDLDETEKQIYYIINDEPKHIDTLSQELGIPVSKLLSSLTILEIKGYVKCVQGRNYILA